jgi:hypothetical protein
MAGADQITGCGVAAAGLAWHYAGKLGATYEGSRRFGPNAFDIMYSYANDDKIAPIFINRDRVLDASNAKRRLTAAF